MSATARRGSPIPTRDAALASKRPAVRRRIAVIRRRGSMGGV